MHSDLLIFDDNVFYALFNDKKPYWETTGDTYAMGLLAKKKKALFTPKKPIKDFTVDDLDDLINNALKDITPRDYKKFLKHEKEYKNGFELDWEIFTDNREGFASYLYYLLVESGIYHIAARVYMKEIASQGKKIEPFSFVGRLVKGLTDKFCLQFAGEYYPSGEYTYTPPTKYNIPNDKISKNIRTATAQEWEYGELQVVEKKAGRKNKQITSTVKFTLDGLKKLGYDNLDVFDLFVVFTCYAIQSAGNKGVSIGALYRAMTGKTGNAKPSDDMRREIITSLTKAMATIVTIDAKGICEWYNYEGKDDYVIGSILPAEIEKQAIINGVKVENFIQFLQEAPPMRVARAKGQQFVTYDSFLLDVPIRMTRQTITLAPCLLQHIEDTRTGKLPSTLLLAEIAKEIQYVGKWGRFTEYVDTCFAYWMGKGYLKAYQIEKDNRGKAIRVKFKLKKKATQELPDGENKG